MKKILFLLVLCSLSIVKINSQVEVFTSDYIALTVPQQYYGEITYINDDLLQEIKDVAEIKNDKSLIRSLPNIVSNVTVYEVDQDGELKVLGVGISGKNKVYQVIYDYSQTQTLLWDNDDGTESVLVGIGVRMVAKVKTKKAGVNLASPFSLTANTKKIEGSLEVRVTGISSAKINGLIPTTTDLSASSISVALQAVATIKSHIYDDETVIIPQYLAYNKIDASIKNMNVNTQKINK